MLPSRNALLISSGETSSRTTVKYSLACSRSTTRRVSVSFDGSNTATRASFSSVLMA